MPNSTFRLPQTLELHSPDNRVIFIDSYNVSHRTHDMSLHCVPCARRPVRIYDNMCNTLTDYFQSHVNPLISHLETFGCQHMTHSFRRWLEEAISEAVTRHNSPMTNYRSPVVAPDRPRIFTVDVPCDVPSIDEPWFAPPEHRQVRSAPERLLIFDESTIFRHEVLTGFQPLHELLPREDLIDGTVTGRISSPPRPSATVLSKVKNNRNLVGCDTSKSNFCKWEKKVKPADLLSNLYDIDGEVPEYV